MNLEIKSSIGTGGSKNKQKQQQQKKGTLKTPNDDIMEAQDTIKLEFENDVVSQEYIWFAPIVDHPAYGKPSPIQTEYGQYQYGQVGGLIRWEMYTSFSNTCLINDLYINFSVFSLRYSHIFRGILIQLLVLVYCGAI